MLMLVFVKDSYDYVCHKFRIIKFKDEYSEGIN